VGTRQSKDVSRRVVGSCDDDDLVAAAREHGDDPLEHRDSGDLRGRLRSSEAKGSPAREHDAGDIRGRWQVRHVDPSALAQHAVEKRVVPLDRQALEDVSRVSHADGAPAARSEEGEQPVVVAAASSEARSAAVGRHAGNEDDAARWQRVHANRAPGQLPDSGPRVRDGRSARRHLDELEPESADPGQQDRAVIAVSLCVAS